LKTGQEVPHSVAILVEELNETPEEMSVSVVIYVEHDSQKGIIIGAQGKKIKDIKYLARKELEDVFGKKVDLDIFVKVKKN
jgi:GTP-binding protein Era